MTVCPIALAVGCRKCFAFSFCPVKSSLGDYQKEVEQAASRPPEASAASQPEAAPQQAKVKAEPVEQEPAESETEDRAPQDESEEASSDES